MAQRVQTSYHYDNNSFSSEADRDDYIRRQLQNEISDEYADRHDGAYPDEKYLNEETERRFAERTGNDALQEGDDVVIVTTDTTLHSLRDIVK